MVDKNCKPKRSKNRTDITDGPRSAELKQNKTKQNKKQKRKKKKQLRRLDKTRVIHYFVT